MLSEVETLRERLEGKIKKNLTKKPPKEQNVGGRS